MIDIDENWHEGFLSGKRVIVGATASISVYRLPDIIREIRREGAEVIVGASEESLELIGEKVLHWASENRVVNKISGDIEHINLFMGRSEDTALLIAPATYNFIGKAASGIADDVPSLFFSFAFGNGNPVIVVPVMHEAMFSNSIFSRNLDKLRSAGVSIVPPHIAAGKAKISEPELVVDYVCRSLGKHPLAGKRSLVIGGSGSEPIDPVRSISNASTGFTGVWFTRNLFREGADDICYVGNSMFPLPGYVRFLKASTMDEFRDRTLLALSEMPPDVVICPAALPDFRPEKSSSEKIDSGSDVKLTLKRNRKLLEDIRARYGGPLVSFKLGDEPPSRKDIGENDFVVFNSYSSRSGPFGEVSNDYILITRDQEIKLGKLPKPKLTLEVIRKVSGALHG
ncbi:MAG: flavoprotein [Thermoplasmataceae archaeon]